MLSRLTCQLGQCLRVCGFHSRLSFTVSNLFFFFLCWDAQFVNLTVDVSSSDDMVWLRLLPLYFHLVYVVLPPWFIVLVAYANCITEFWSWIAFTCPDGTNLSVLWRHICLTSLSHCVSGIYPGYWVPSTISVYSWLLLIYCRLLIIIEVGIFVCMCICG